MSARNELTAARLRELLHYDQETGVFTWVARRRRVRIGAVAGGLEAPGYHVIRIDGRRHKGHRLAWLYQTGEWPRKDLDHINGIKGDNRICNLREATISQNKANMGALRNNTSGFKGVLWCARNKKWVAQIQANGKRRHIGYFNDPHMAMMAYNATAWQHFGKFAKLAPEYILEFRRWRALRNLADLSIYYAEEGGK